MNRKLFLQLFLLLGLSGLCVALTGRAEIDIAAPNEPAKPGRLASVPPPANPARPARDPGRTASDTDLVTFRNGDVLHGRLLALDLGGVARWQHPDAAGVIEFLPANIVQVKLATPPSATTPPQATVRLTNDDQLRGKIVSLDSGKLVLATAYAGQVTLQRSMLTSISPRAGSTAALYRGPTAEEDWQKSRQERGWEYKNGALVSGGSGAIGRDLKLPERARIEFDLAWRNYPYLQVAFYTDNLEQVSGNCYMLQISGNSVYLQRGRNHNLNNLGGGTNVEDLQRKSHARFAILIDKPKKSIALFIDNEMVKQWVDSSDFAGAGRGVVFQAQGQGPLRVSNIMVSDWNGEFQSDGNPVAKDQDITRFLNNDKVSGQLKAIANGAITFVTAFATLDIPLERAAQIDFASDKAERARRQAYDVTALFPEGGRVTFGLEKLDERTLIGVSENFGRLTFTREAFQELRLHIYDETVKRTSGDEWEF